MKKKFAIISVWNWLPFLLNCIKHNLQLAPLQNDEKQTRNTEKDNKCFFLTVKMSSKDQITLGGVKRRNVQAITNLLSERRSPKRGKANKQQLLHWTAVLLGQRPQKCSQESCKQITACFFLQGFRGLRGFWRIWGVFSIWWFQPNPLESGMRYWGIICWNVIFET